MLLTRQRQLQWSFDNTNKNAMYATTLVTPSRVQSDPFADSVPRYEGRHNDDVTHG